MRVSKDLHELLARAGEPPPYVLVGSSLGGLNARVYNGLYPGEVAGMVLVDAAHEDEPRRAPKFMLGPTLPRYLWRPLHLIGQAAWRTGLVRLTTSSVPLPDDPARRTREQMLGFAATARAVAISSMRQRQIIPQGAPPAARRSSVIGLTRGEYVAFWSPEVDRNRRLCRRMHEIQPHWHDSHTGTTVIVAKSAWNSQNRPTRH